MITMTRSAARLVRAVFRRALGFTARGQLSIILIEAGPDGLVFKARCGAMAVEYRVPGSHSSESIAVPFELLCDCDGSQDQPVQLTSSGKGTIEAMWQDGCVPQVKKYEARKPADVLRSFPTVPDNLTENHGRLIAALKEAADTADIAAVRYATNRIQLQGTTGSVVATNGRQLLVQRGFTFPWTENLLVPASGVFGNKELAGGETVYIGRSQDWIYLHWGSWVFHLEIDQDACYPNIEDHIPSPDVAQTRLQLSAGDAGFLADTLERLPCHDECCRPVTLDLNGQVIVRAKSVDQPRVTELVLAGSTCTGAPLTINTDRRYLARAIRLGFQEVLLYEPSKAVLCRDERRRYIWMPLEATDAIKPSKNPIRIESLVQEAATPSRQPKQQRNETTMPRKKTSDYGVVPASGTANGAVSDPTHGDPQGATQGAENASHVASAGNGTTPGEQAAEGSLIEQAEAVRTSLRESIDKLGDLITALKRHRKQSRLVQSTLSSLRQLQSLDA